MKDVDLEIDEKQIQAQAVVSDDENEDSLTQMDATPEQLEAEDYDLSN